jgi:hypothetical protein
MDPLYLDSLCAGPWLHRYKIIRTSGWGVRELCLVCRDVQHYRNDVPNRLYLSTHIRESLQFNRKIFHHEYPNQR